MEDNGPKKCLVSRKRHLLCMYRKWCFVFLVFFVCLELVFNIADHGLMKRNFRLERNLLDIKSELFRVRGPKVIYFFLSEENGLSVANRVKLRYIIDRFRYLWFDILNFWDTMKGWINVGYFFVFESKWPISVFLCEAWSQSGHEAIGMTAMSAITPKAMVQLKRILNGKDIVDASSFGITLEKEAPTSFFLQYQVQSTERKQTNSNDSDSSFRNGIFRDICVYAENMSVSYENCYEDTSSTNLFLNAFSRKVSSNSNLINPPNMCLLNAIRYLFRFLTNSDAQILKSHRNRNFDQSSLENATFHMPVDISEADALKLLIVLIGDLHQPLHFGFTSDLLGTLSFSSYYKNISFFDMLESHLIDELIATTNWYGGWTHINFVRSQFDADSLVFQQINETAFDTWADESFNFLCSTVYRMAEQDGVGNVELKQFIRERLLIAGARVAVVVNFILSSRQASKLRAGPEISSFEGKKFKTSQTWIWNFGANLSILVVILMAFVLAKRYYFSPRDSTKKVCKNEIKEPKRL